MEFDLGRKSIAEWAQDAPEGTAGDSDFTPAQEKFVVEMPIGKGGMGEVFLVTDQDLRRQVAMKVLRRDIGESRDQRLQFIAEAAERFAAEGKTASEYYLSLRGKITAAEQAAEQEAKKYKPFQPVKEKRSMIEARENVEKLKIELALAFAESQELLDGALLQEPDNKSARAELARIWKDRLEDAERRRDKADEAYALVMIERYADVPLSQKGELSCSPTRRRR